MEKSIEKRSVEKVEFAGRELMAVKENERVFVALKPICDALGLDWAPQHRGITEDPVLASVIIIMMTTGSDGKQYEMVCLPLDYLNGWLFKISAKRYKGERQAAIIQYQKECYRALAAHFLGPAALAGRAPAQWQQSSTPAPLALESWDAAAEADLKDKVDEELRKATAHLRSRLRQWAASQEIGPDELLHIAQGAFAVDPPKELARWKHDEVWGFPPYHPETRSRVIRGLGAK